MHTKSINCFMVLVLMLLPVGVSASGSKYFYINLELEQIAVTIRVNDIPVFKDYVKHSARVSVPINYALINKLNSIQIALHDGDNGNKFNARAFLSYALGSKSSLDKRALNSIDSFEVNVVEMSIQAKLPAHYQLQEQDNQVVVKGTFEVGDIFPQWKWLGGLPIQNDSATYNALLNEYKELYTDLKNKNEKLLEEKIALKTNEYKQYYFLNYIKDAQNKTGYSDVLHNKNAKLVSFWEKGMKLEVFANGKLARIVDGDGDSPIVYLMGDGNTAYVIKVIFMKDADGQWRIIR